MSYWSSYMNRIPANRLVAAPIALYLVLAILYMLAIPIGEAPDEPGHLRCIEQVAIESRLPTVSTTTDEAIDWWARENITSDYMCYHMPAYYVVSGYLLRALSILGNESLHYEFPPTNPDFTSNSPMFVHSQAESIWSMSQPVTLIGLRIFSILLGLVILWGTYRIARRLFPEQILVAVMAVTIIAGWPQFLFLSRSISNDMPAIALAVATLVVLTDVGRPNRYVLAAFLSSLAFLTKLSVAFSIGLVLGAWLIEVGYLANNRKPYIRALVIGGVLWFAVIAVVRLNPILWSNWNQSVSEFSQSNANASLVAYWQQIYVWTISSGWAWFGWLTVMPPPLHSQIWWFFIEILSLLGLYAAIKKASGRSARFQILVLVAWGAAILVSYVRLTSNRWQPQFRLAMSVLPVLASFAAGGILSRLEKHPCWERVLLAGLTTGLFIYNFWLLTAVIQPLYY